MPDNINTEILDKLDKVGDRLKHVQETNDRLEKQYDGLDLDNIKGNSKKLADSLQEIQDIKLKQEAAEKHNKERIDMLEIELAKRANGIGDSDAEKAKKRIAYKHAINSYYKYSYAMDQEMIDDIATQYTDITMYGAQKEDKAAYLKAMVSGVNPAGGYWILPEISAEISKRVFETSPIRSIASVSNTNTNMVIVPLDDQDIDCGWVGEIEQRPDTITAEVGEAMIPIHEVYAMPKLSQNMIDDSGFDVESWHMEKSSARIARKENEAFVKGSGAKTPRGILSYDAWTNIDVYETGKIGERVTSGSTGVLDKADDLINLQSDLLEYYDVNAVWGMRRKTFSTITTLKDDFGQYLMDPMMLKSGTNKVLLGAQVIFMADLPAIGEGTIPILYGDFREGYTIKDRFGIRVRRDDVTEKPYIKLYTTKRVGGAVTNFQAIKRLKIAD